MLQELIWNKRKMLLDFFEITSSLILRPDFSIWCRKIWSHKCWKLLALMLQLQMECFHLSKPLANHEHGKPASGNFNYRSVVGIILHLAGCTHPGIAYADNFAARYMFHPKLVHKHTIKRICCYLNATFQDWSWNLVRNSWRSIVFLILILLGFIGMKQWIILSVLKEDLDMWLWLPIVL